jgi:hypothetical protein
MGFHNNYPGAEKAFTDIPIDLSQVILSEEALENKVKKWRQLNNKRYSEKRKFGYSEAQKDALPPEILRYTLPPSSKFTHLEKS